MNNKGCFGIGLVGLIVIIVLVAVVGFWGVGKYNGLVQENNNVLNKWSNVETVYQKRANLIPNLQNTVKSYAKFEQETLTKVVEARSKATQITIDPTNMTEEDMAKFQKAQGELSSSLGRLMMVAEQYPDLKAETFPTSLIVAMFSKFKAKPYFKADEGASKAPEVFKD